MDPMTIIITALVLGIAAGVKPTAEQAVKDAYSGLRTYIEDRYKVSVTNLERKPYDETRQDIVREDLMDAGASSDSELLSRAETLKKLVEDADPAEYQIVQEQIGGKRNKQEAPGNANAKQSQRDGEDNTQKIT